MSNLKVKDGDGGDVFIKGTGAGTDLDPFVPVQDVNIQDQTSRPVSFYFTKIKGAPTTLAVAASTNDTSVTVVSAAGCAVGDYFGIFQDDKFYFGLITNLPGGNVIELGTRIDGPFTIGATAACFDRDMSVDGSVTPEIFSVDVGAGSTQSVDITRIVYTLQTADTPSLSDFGDITGGLENGLLLRRVDGTVENIDVFRDNAEFSIKSGGDLTLFSTGGFFGGTEGFTVRTTFAGQDKRGVAIRLNPGDSLELVNSDNLSSLNSFLAVAQGHFVED